VKSRSTASGKPEASAQIRSYMAALSPAARKPFRALHAAVRGAAAGTQDGFSYGAFHSVSRLQRGSSSGWCGRG
jgi:hypothetical protein